MEGRARSWLSEVAVVIAGAMLLLGVIAADGRPAVFSDTNIYVWMGRLQLRPIRYALGPVIGGPTSAAQDPETADEQASELALRRTEMAARSPWFGLTAYIVSALGSLWALAALQSLAASYAIRALWRAAVGGPALEHLILMAALALGTTLPFFAGFAMPDVWAGVGLTALATLLFFSHTLGRLTIAALFLLVLAALSFHQSNAPVALLAVLVAAPAAHFLWRMPWRRMALGAGLLIAAVAGAGGLQIGYDLAIKASTGDTLRSPPFLAARLLADGPGRAYLRRSCHDGAQWALCRFQNLPLDNSQDILWSGDPAKGVFGRAGVAERIRIDREQIRFVLAVIAFDPVGSFKAALVNSWRTLISVNLEDPLRDPHFYLTDPDWRDTYIADLVHDMGSCGASEHDCRPRLDPAIAAYWHGAVCLIALAWLAVAASCKRLRYLALDAKLGPTTILLLASLLCNAAVLGVLSGPFARYQARIAWISPMTALLVGAVALRRRQPLRHVAEPGEVG
jgi:hypothetical protein